MKEIRIYMNGRFLEKSSSRKEAEATIRRYEREDRYDVEVEGYAIPLNGFPVYTIEER